MAGTQHQCARMTALCARMTRFLCARMTRLQSAQMTRFQCAQMTRLPSIPLSKWVKTPVILYMDDIWLMNPFLSGMHIHV